MVVVGALLAVVVAPTTDDVGGEAPVALELVLIVSLEVATPV